MVDRYFDPAAFEAELAACPAPTPRPPAGCSSPASAPSPPAASACATSADGACEMKRMFVLPEHQGHRLGLALGRALPRRGGRGRLPGGAPRHRPAPARGAPALRPRSAFVRGAPYYEIDPEMAEFLDLHGARQPAAPGSPSGVGLREAEQRHRRARTSSATAPTLVTCSVELGKRRFRRPFRTARSGVQIERHDALSGEQDIRMLRIARASALCPL